VDPLTRTHGARTPEGGPCAAAAVGFLLTVWCATKVGRDRLKDNERGRTMSETDTIERPSERAKVESWRLHVLIEAGYPLPLAERVAVSECDLHRAVELVKQGCEPTVAAEILL
jgi:hypothetical protein